jgi:enoyl-CoA hydratase/carnithine racemase
MAYDGYKGLTVEVDRGVAFATIDLPPMNLLGAELIGSLARLSQQVAADDAVRVVVLRSADPDFFIAHGDVETILGMNEDAAGTAAALGFVDDTLERLREMPAVTIAQIEGCARGGGSEVALACDMRFAAIGRAVLGQPEVGLGIIPGAGGTHRLARLVGRARACEIVLGGRDFGAEEAERYGWVNRALPADEIGPFVDTLARRIARFPTQAIAAAKEVINAADASVAAGLERERAAFAQCVAGDEARARMQRFLERGGQTREGERALGEMLESLDA